MNETLYIKKRSEMNVAFRKYMKAKKALYKGELTRKAFDLILNNYSSICKKNKTKEYLEYKEKRQRNK